jgi:TPR repeat protein
LEFAPAVPEAARGDDAYKTSMPPSGQIATAPVEIAPPPAPAVGPVELKVAPAPPSGAALKVAPALPSGAALKVAPVLPSGAAAPPADPGQAARSDAESTVPALPVVVPAKPSMRPEEVALMIERGRTLFDSGDIAAARLFFRRAANAGDAGAALAMGATYDPEVLGQRFIRGIEADAREAQKWYDKARALGGSRVEMLAHR